MAFPTVAASAQSSEPTNVKNHDVSLPSGISAGDLLIAFFAHDGNVTTTWPSGWTQFVAGSQGTAISLKIAYRIANGSEGTTIVVTTSGGERSAHQVYRITGWHGTTPPEGAANPQAGATNPPALTPSWGAADTLWWAVSGHNNGDGSYTAAPTNYTNLTQNSAPGTVGALLATSRRALNAVSDDPGTFTPNTGPAVAATVAVRPAPAGGGSFTLGAATGSFSLSGISAGLRASRRLGAASGSFSLSGVSVVLRRGYTLLTSPGAFNDVGNSVSLRTARRLAAGVGSFSFVGQAAGLIYVSPSGQVVSWKPLITRRRRGG